MLVRGGGVRKLQQVEHSDCIAEQSAKRGTKHVTEPISGDPKLALIRDALAVSQEGAPFFEAKPPAARAELATIYASTFRRFMVPLRSIGGAARWFLRGSWAWITLRPGSRPRRTIRSMLLRTLRFVLARPNLTRIARQPLERFPLLKSFKRLAFAVLLAKDVAPPSRGIFSERERFVHARLEAALKRRAN